MKPVKNSLFSWKPTNRSQYEFLQKKWWWVNNIQRGTAVRITGKARADEMGWDNTWPTEMDRTIDQIAHVTMDSYPNEPRGISLDNMFSYPFWVLEVVR